MENQIPQQSSVSETNQSLLPSKDQPINSSSSSHLIKTILIEIVIVIVIIAFGVGAYILATQKSQPIQQKISGSQIVTQLSPILTPTIIADGKQTLNAFLEAVKVKNITLARTYISANANKSAFRSILNSQYNGPSIYNKNFTFAVSDEKIDDNQVTTEIKTLITVGGQSLQAEYMLGKENGTWRLLDEWVQTSSSQLPSNFADLLNSPSPTIEFSRAVIRTDGPVHFSLYNPLYGDVGFGTNSTLQEIGAFYNGESGVPQSISLQLSGVWIMKVVGSNSGNFSIITEIVDANNHQIGTFKNTINANEVKYFSVTEPSDLGVPISILPLN